MSESSEQFEPKPLIFGRYCLLERLNAGGMAEIFRARPFYPTDSTKYLVVKRILPHLADDADFINMFVDEARITAQLSHPNVCQLYELGLIDDTYYIVMEYIAGRDILALINWYRRQRSFLPPSQVAFIVAEICAGLDYAHAKRDSRGQSLGVVHRDISPQNILIGFDGSVKVIDFGIARASVRRQRTEVGILKGKFGYMSPEQVRGEDVDNRSDVFATGILLWEMLTARRLFYSKNEYEIIERVRGMEVPPPSTINPQIPPELDSIIVRALDRNRETRYQSAGEMESDLREWLRGLRPPYSRRALAAWMQGTYAQEIRQEKERDQQFLAFERPSDVLLYWEKIGHPLPDLQLERLASEMTDVERTRLDTELTSRSEEVLVAAEHDPIPEMTKVDVRNRRVRRRRWKPWASVLALVITLVVVFAMIAIVVGASLGTIGRMASLEISVPHHIQAVLEIDGDATHTARTVDDRKVWTLTRVNPGQHTIRVLADGYEPMEERVLVQTGQSIQLDLDPIEILPEIIEMQLILPEDVPGMRVMVDGEELNMAERPFVFPLALEDALWIDAAAPGYWPVRKPMKRAGKEDRFKVSLRPLSPQLTITMDQESQVRVNRQTVAQHALRAIIDTLDPFDVHRIEVRSDEPGFQPHRTSFVFEGTYQRLLHVQPLRIGQSAPQEEAEPGVLQFIGDTFYYVEIDGQNLGFATGLGPRRLALSSGAHEVVLRRGASESVFRIDVRPGKVETIRVPLYVP